MVRTRDRLWFAGLALVLSGCAGVGSARRTELAEIAARHEAERSRFEAAKAEFAQRNPVPFELDFGDEGTIVIAEVSFQGLAGREEFWLRYTWINTTGRVVDAVYVTLAVFDPESGLEVEEEIGLMPPLLASFGPDSTYSTYVRVVAGDARLGAGLSFELRPRAESWQDGPP